MPFDPTQASRPKALPFKFGPVGDGFKIRITDVSDDVRTQNEGRDETSLVLLGDVLAAKGGDREDKDDPTTDTPVGEQRAVWLRYEPYATTITTACALALKEVGAKAFEVGGILSCRHTELGRKQTDPKKSRAKLYKATYERPASPAIGAAPGDDDPELQPF